MSIQDNLAKAIEASNKLVEDVPTREEFSSAFENCLKIITTLGENLKADIEKRLSQVKNGKDGRDGKDGKSIVGPRGPMGPVGRAIFGAKGDKGDPGQDGSPDTPEQVRDKLETLKDEERLDASAIKNLPDAVKETVRVIGNHGPLSSLIDVSVQGITVGQALKWDGIRWIPFTPAGSNTAVYGEAPTDSGDQTNFTLAHTPVSGTLRLYRGGAYQQAGAGKDYTISTNTITLANVLVSGEVLQCDYEY